MLSKEMRSNKRQRKEICCQVRSSHRKRPRKFFSPFSGYRDELQV
jgi:hypothetical protein